MFLAKCVATVAIFVIATQSGAATSMATGADVMADRVLAAKVDAEVAHWSAEARRETLEARLREAQLGQLIREDRHRILVLQMQSWLSVVLTVFVIAVVTAGIYLSYLQFRATVASAEDRQEGRAESASRLLLSKEGFELSSSVIGLFVLVASMFFFYFYITEVYPIRPMTEAAASPAPATPPPAS